MLRSLGSLTFSCQKYPIILFVDHSAKAHPASCSAYFQHVLLLSERAFECISRALDPAHPKAANFHSWSSHAIPQMGNSQPLGPLSPSEGGQPCPWLGWLMKGRVCWWSGSAPPAGLVRCLVKIRSDGADTHNSATTCSSPHAWLSDLIFKRLVHITNSPKRRIKDVR